MASSVTITPFEQLMINARHTVPSLADATGLNQSTVRKALTGEKILHEDTAELIARALKVPLEEAFPSGNYVVHGHPPCVSHSSSTRSGGSMRICPHCRIALPVAGSCDNCG